MKADHDWAYIARNVRQSRIIHGYSQEELARLAGLGTSTIYSVERAQPVSHRSLLKLCAAFDYSLDGLEKRRQDVMTEETGPMQHHAAAAIWTAGVDRRAKVPPDNFQRIQDPQERLRLGNLGMVSVFLSTMSFIMPEGPGPMFIELFSRVEETINPEIYRDALIICAEGWLRLGIAGETFEMVPGDVLGYRTRDLQWFEPCPGSKLPVRITWVGAVRTGESAQEARTGERVKRRGKRTQGRGP